LITLGIFFDSFDLACFGYTAPSIAKFWGLTMKWVGWTNAVTMFGQVVGSFIAGGISDKIGRKKAFIGGVCTYGIGTILCGLASTPSWFVVFRFISCVGTMGLSVIAMVYISEIAPAERRGKLGLAVSGLALTAVPLSGLFARWVVAMGPEGWRSQYYLGGALGLVIALSVLFVCTESPRWLVSKSRPEDAKAIMDRLLPRVKTDLSTFVHAVQHRVVEEKLAAWTALRKMFNSFYIGRTILLMLIAMTACNTASTLQLMMPTLLHERGLSIGNSILLVSLMSWGLPIGVFCCAFVLDKGARKWTLAVAGMVAGVGAVVLGFVGGFAPIATAGLVTQIFSAIYYFVIQVYSAESYATNMRSTSHGAVIAVGRLSGAVWLLYTASMAKALGFTGFIVLTGACIFILQFFVMGFGHKTSRRTLESISGEA
jgi:putative MFS transporter